MLMNSDFMIAQTRYFAERLQREKPGDLPAQISLAWKLAFAQPAPAGEVEAAIEFVQRQAEQFQLQDTPQDKKKKNDPAAQKTKQELAALASFCQVLLSTNQFIYVE